MSHMIFLSEKGFDEEKIISDAPSIGLVDLEIFFSKNVVRFEYLESGGNMSSYCEKIAESMGATSAIGSTLVDDCVDFFIVESPISSRTLQMSWHMSNSPWKTGVEKYKFLRNMGYDSNIARASVGKLKFELKQIVNQNITDDEYKEMLGDEYNKISNFDVKETDEEFLVGKHEHESE